MCRRRAAVSRRIWIAERRGKGFWCLVQGCFSNRFMHRQRCLNGMRTIKMTQGTAGQVAGMVMDRRRLHDLDAAECQQHQENGQ